VLCASESREVHSGEIVYSKRVVIVLLSGESGDPATWENDRTQEHAPLTSEDHAYWHMRLRNGFMHN